MPINNIPGTPPFQPPIPDRPETLPPEEGRKWTLSSNTVDESGYIYERFVTVSRSQKWKRVFAATPECGNEVEQTISRKVGVSRTETSEISSKLGVTFEELGAEIGAKLGVSVTISEEDTETFKASTTAPKCKSRTYVVWQLVEIYDVEIIDEYYGWPPDFTFTLNFEVPLQVFDPDHKDFDNAECCPEEVAQLKTEGFNCPYLVVFNDTSMVILGKTNEDGRISFAEIDGKFQLGGLVPYTALSQDLQKEITPREEGPELTFGTVKILDDTLGFVCNELNLVNQPGFVRSQERILNVFNSSKSDFMKATGGVGKEIIDRLINIRGDTGFQSLRTIETLEGFTREEIYQLVVPIITNGQLQLSESIMDNAVLGRKGDVVLLEGVGKKTAQRLSEVGLGTITALAAANRSRKIQGVRNFSFLVDSSRIALDFWNELITRKLSFQDVQVVAELYCSVSTALKADDSLSAIEAKIEQLNIKLPNDYKPQGLLEVLQQHKLNE